MIRRIRHHRDGVARMTLAVAILIAAASIHFLGGSDRRAPGLLRLENAVLSGCAQSDLIASRLACGNPLGNSRAGTSVSIRRVE